MLGKPVDNRTEQEKFTQEFEQTVNEKIDSYILTELRAAKDTFKTLGLTPHNGQTSIWGLIAFGETHNYFYQAPQDSYLAQFMQKHDSSFNAEEKVINISDFNINYSLLPKRKFEFLFPERKRTIDASFEKDGITYNFMMVFCSDASKTIEKLQKK